MSLYQDASLVMIPSAYKDGKLYSIKPTDGSGDFTFSRGSNLAATRVDENGLIEKGRENLILQSNQFDTTWGTFDTSVTSGQSGYDGSSDAWLLDITSATGFQTLRQTGLSFSGVNTFSIYAKAGTLDWMRITTGVTNTYFDIANGVVGATDTSIGASIEAVGNGYYRCSIPVSGTITLIYIYPATGNNNVSQSSGNIYIQDAQLEAGLVATDYIETGASTAQAGILEDMPRLDYSGGASCPALLLEPQRSNLFTNSEYIEGSSWSQDISNFTRVSNQGISPEGLNNATKITPTIAGSPYWYQNNSVTSGTLYTNAIFAKADGFNVLQITGSTGMPSGKHNFDLSSGTHSGDYSSAFMDDLGNGWYRCGVSEAASSTTSGARYLFAIVPNIESARLESVTPNGTDGILVYGATFEQGSYPTSYIPCYGAATTRSADVCNKTGISSLIGQEQGTLFIEATNFFLSGNRTIALLYTSYSAFYQVYINASNQVRVDINGSFLFLGGSIAANTNYKIAFAYKSGEYALYINGTQIATSTNTTIPSSLTDYYLGNSLGGEQSGEFAQTALFKTRLTNGELAALTTI